jgi:hypothetical protein
MKKLFLSLIVVFLMSSCATLFNSKYHKVSFSSDAPAKIIIDADTISVEKTTFWKSDVKHIELERSNVSKEVIVIRDTDIDTILLTPNLSNIYYLNIYTLGIGYIFDYDSPKIFSYADFLGNGIAISDRYIQKHSKEHLQYLASDEYKMRYSHKGVLNLKLGIPEGNLFNYDFEGYGRKTAEGFLGLSVGLDYFYKDNRFINLSWSYIMDFIAPFPAPFSYAGMRDTFGSSFWTLSHNHKIGKIALGYGFSYSTDTWNTINSGLWRDYADPELVNQPSIYRKAQSLGFVFPIHYYSRNSSFYWGVVYRPTFLQFDDKVRFKYQHTINFELGWRIRLAK